MKRLHLHVAVDDLNKSIGFYSTLFGTAPSVAKDDYAKWMLDNDLITQPAQPGAQTNDLLPGQGFEDEE